MATDESGSGIGPSRVITERDTDRLIKASHLSLKVCVCVCACCLQTNPLVPDLRDCWQQAERGR